MSADESLEPEMQELLEALAVASPEMEASDPEIIALRESAERVIRAIESRTDAVEELSTRSFRAIGPPVAEDVMDDLGSFVTAAAPVHANRTALYAALRAIHEDHTRMSDIDIEPIAEAVLDREIRYAEAAEGIEETLSEATAAYDEDQGSDFTDPSTGSPPTMGARFEAYSDPNNRGMIPADSEALYTLYLDNTGADASSDLRVIAPFDELEHFNGGFVRDVPAEAVTLEMTATLETTGENGGDETNPSGADGTNSTDDGMNSPGGDGTNSSDGDMTNSADDGTGGETSDTETDEPDELRIEDAESVLSLDPIAPGSGVVFGILVSPIETGSDRIDVAVQRTTGDGNWETVADQSVSAQAFLSDELEAVAAEILDPTPERRADDDDGDNDAADDSGGVPALEGAVLGGAGVLTAGGYLAYRRFSGTETDGE